jgi:hypothetical protein
MTGSVLVATVPSAVEVGQPTELLLSEKSTSVQSPPNNVS